MKIVCPNFTESDPLTHIRFTTPAWVSETWVVDDEGYFVEVVPEQGEIIRKPNSESDYQCTTCGEWGKVT